MADVHHIHEVETSSSGVGILVVALIAILAIAAVVYFAVNGMYVSRTTPPASNGGSINVNIPPTQSPTPAPNNY